VMSNRYFRRVVDDELDELVGAAPAIAIEGAKAVGTRATATRRATTTHHLDDAAGRAIAVVDPRRLLTAPPPVLIDEWQYMPDVWGE
jgi:hypothetical protein